MKNVYYSMCVLCSRKRTLMRGVSTMSDQTREVTDTSRHAEVDKLIEEEEAMTGNVSISGYRICQNKRT